MNASRRLVLAALVLAGCGHTLVLTAAGNRVQKVERSRLPEDCQLVGDVAIGIPPDAALAVNEDELTLLMRNKAGELGGDHLVVEHTDSEPNANGGQRWFGNGSAYRCTAQPATAGGEHTEPGATPPEGTAPEDDGLGASPNP